ncbi:MAG: BrnA antitoxin family protein [Bryobacteraceae bacterium]
MRKLTVKERDRLKALSNQGDDTIDLSDMPEVKDIPSGAVIGKFYRPIKQSVTIRLDADVVAWMKELGEGYQTRINTYLRTLMQSGR